MSPSQVFTFPPSPDSAAVPGNEVQCTAAITNKRFPGTATRQNHAVMMTTVSTMAAVVTTPLLVKLLVGSIVPVDATALVSSTIQVAILTQ